MRFPVPDAAIFIGSLLPGPPASTGGPEPPLWMVVAPYAIIFVTFYFLLFAPTRKRQQKTQQMHSALKAGDRVMLTCGIYGTVVGIAGDVVQLRVADKVKIDVAKSSVAGVYPDAPAREDKS